MPEVNNTSLSHPKVPAYIYKLCRRFRKNQTTAEVLLWDCLRTKRLNSLKFRRQYPIGRYIADFYCRERKLVIELERQVHQLPDQKEYDDLRQEAIKMLGLKMLRFSNEEIFNNLEEVLTMITYPPESPSPIFGEGDGRRGGEVK